MSQIAIPPEIAQLPPKELATVAGGLMEMALAKIQGQLDMVRFDLETHEALLSLRNGHGSGTTAEHVMAYQEQRAREAALFMQAGPVLATDPAGGPVVRAAFTENSGKVVCTLLCAPGPFKPIHMTEHLGTTPDEALAAAQAAAGKVAEGLQAAEVKP